MPGWLPRMWRQGPPPSESERGGGAALIPLERSRTHEVRSGASTLAAAHFTKMEDWLQTAY